MPDLAPKLLEAFANQLAALLRGEYKAYALPWVAAASRERVLEPLPAATRAAIFQGLRAAAAEGTDGVATSAAKVLARCAGDLGY